LSKIEFARSFDQRKVSPCELGLSVRLLCWHSHSNNNCSWLVDLVPELLNSSLINKFEELKIQRRSIFQMNINHFIRLGASEQLANKIFHRLIELKSISNRPSNTLSIISSFIILFLTIPSSFPPSDSRIKVSIIGTAGRSGSDRSKMTRELFNQMIRQCEQTIERFSIDKKHIHLISGGAAWSGPSLHY
jgi:hypothetical protein